MLIKQKSNDISFNFLFSGNFSLGVRAASTSGATVLTNLPPDRAPLRRHLQHPPPRRLRGHSGRVGCDALWAWSGYGGASVARIRPTCPRPASHINGSRMRSWSGQGPVISLSRYVSSPMSSAQIIFLSRWFLLCTQKYMNSMCINEWKICSQHLKAEELKSYIPRTLTQSLAHVPHIMLLNVTSEM